ncbi:MAG: pyridoxine 5'-phosphate synthase [Candidatus Omnitrophica bacterium]|nr:pyridoxine 5'-phosphate synthase [Candidatus Omnitrophota bacterium]
MTKLGVNIDHVATIREARKTFEPDPVEAVYECEKAGCDGIVCHLRKDRRHINDTDLERIKDAVTTRLNLEMSVDSEILDIACRIKPDQATIVPENRQEITTEGGLDVVGNMKRVKEVVGALQRSGITVSLFIDPEVSQVDAAVDSGVKMVEFHIGGYAEQFHSGGDHKGELNVLEKVSSYARGKDITVCAGHGLTYQNVEPIAAIDGMYELNIGHSIISRSVFVGLAEAVRMMKESIR